MKKQNATHLYVVEFNGVCLGGYALVKARSGPEAKRKLVAHLRATAEPRRGFTRNTEDDLDVRKVKFTKGVDVIWDGDY